CSRPRRPPRAVRRARAPRRAGPPAVRRSRKPPARERPPSPARSGASRRSRRVPRAEVVALPHLHRGDPRGRGHLPIQATVEPARERFRARLHGPRGDLRNAFGEIAPLPVAQDPLERPVQEAQVHHEAGLPITGAPDLHPHAPFVRVRARQRAEAAPVFVLAPIRVAVAVPGREADLADERGVQTFLLVGGRRMRTPPDGSRSRSTPAIGGEVRTGRGCRPGGDAPYYRACSPGRAPRAAPGRSRNSEAR